MGLNDYSVTRQRILKYLQEKGRTREWLLEHTLEPGEREEDFDSLLQELKDDKFVRNQFSTIHLITKDTEERAREAKNKKGNVTKVANPWVWYAFHPDSAEFRMQLRDAFTKEDGRIFKALGIILLNERRPYVGERISGDMNEEEGMYITAVNELLKAYVDKRKNG